MTWMPSRRPPTGHKDNASSDNFDQMGYDCPTSTRRGTTPTASRGAPLLRLRQCEVTPNTPEMVAAMQWVYDYCKDLGPDKVQAFHQPR